MDNNLPVITDDNFFAEAHRMDLSELKDKMYLVAVSTGDRNKSKFVSTTVRGPYNFPEMAEEIGHMWEQEQHHGKPIILSKERNKPIKTLDANTVDYLECHYKDIIMESLLDGSLTSEGYTCRAGIVDDDSANEDVKQLDAPQ